MENKVEQKTILITGFGPFRGHDVNASWEAVKICLQMCSELEICYNVKLVGVEVPVAYRDVNQVVPKMCEEYKPAFIIHVGVSSGAKFLTIESTAHGSGYVKPDIYNQLPYDVDQENKVYHTEFDIKKLAQTINDNAEEAGCKAIISHNAGRYLCEYIFYKSLNIDCSRVLFIHVPDMDVYPSEQTAKGLYFVIQQLLKCNGSESQKS